MACGAIWDSSTRRSSVWSVRHTAYADALVAKGDLEAARRWFAMASAMDSELETDAAERLDELDGVTIIESDAGADASTDPDTDPT